MSIDILLWIGGMLFSLGVFAVKVGLGLRYGRTKPKGVASVLVAYLLLFVVLATLSRPLMIWAAPILNKGPYLHLLMSAALMIWGLFIVRGRTDNHRCEPKKANRHRLSTLVLITPCPVCLSAMLFSTWAAIGVVKLPGPVVGMLLGLAFAFLTLVMMALSALSRLDHPETALGLTMVTIGLYFALSLFLPAKIEEAKRMYASMAENTQHLSLYHAGLTAAVLVAAGAVGFFSANHKEVKE